MVERQREDLARALALREHYREAHESEEKRDGGASDTGQQLHEAINSLETLFKDFKLPSDGAISDDDSDDESKDRDSWGFLKGATLSRWQWKKHESSYGTTRERRAMKWKKMLQKKPSLVRNKTGRIYIHRILH